MAKIISDKILTSRQFAEAYSGNYYTCCDTWSEVRNCLRSEQIYIGPGLPLSQIPYEFAKVPDEKQPTNDLKVESLDDLFDEELTVDNNDDFPMPEVESDGPSELDIQKELEAKFDELFGPLGD